MATRAQRQREQEERANRKTTVSLRDIDTSAMRGPVTVDGGNSRMRGPVTQQGGNSRMRGPVTQQGGNSRLRGPVTTRGQRTQERRANRVQRESNRAAATAAAQAQEEANNPSPRPTTEYATSQPVNPVGAAGLREQRVRAATQPPSRTEGLTQAQQAELIGAGNQPADGVGNGQPTMAERYQNASPEEQAAMIDSQKIDQTLGPESLPLLLKGAPLLLKGAVGAPVALGGRALTGALQNFAGKRAGQIATSALRNPAGRTGTPGPAARVAGTGRGRTDDLLGSGRSARGGRSGQGGREATPTTGSGRSSVSDTARDASMRGRGRNRPGYEKQRVRADADGTVNYGTGTGARGGSAGQTTGQTANNAKGAAGATTAAGGAGKGAREAATGAAETSTAYNAGRAVNGLIKGARDRSRGILSKLRSVGTGAVALGGAYGLGQMLNPDAPGNRGEAGDGTGGGSAAPEGQYWRGDDPDNPGATMMSDERFEGASLRDLPTEQDTNAIVVDGNRQGNVPASLTRRWDTGTNRSGGLNSREQAMLNVRNEQMAARGGGLRGGNNRIEQASPVISDREMQSIRADAAAQRRDLERSVKNVSPGRAARILAANTTADIASKMIQNRVGARAPNEAEQNRINLQEDGRQSDSRVAQQDINSQRGLMAAGLRAGNQNTRGAATAKDIAESAEAMAGSVYSDFQRSGLSGYYGSQEDLQGALTGYLGRTADAREAGALPPSFSDRAAADMFQLSHALASAQSGGLFKWFGGTVGANGEPAMDPGDTFGLLQQLVENEDDGKWTGGAGQEFRLDQLDGPAKRLYQKFKDNYMSQ